MPFSAQHDVFQNTERINQHEVLVYHTDTYTNSIARGIDTDLVTIDYHLTAVRLVEAVEDTHQRGFAGSVLTDNAVYGSAANREINILIRANRAKPFRDTAKLYRKVRADLVRTI